MTQFLKTDRPTISVAISGSIKDKGPRLDVSVSEKFFWTLAFVTREAEMLHI